MSLNKVLVASLAKADISAAQLNLSFNDRHHASLSSIIKNQDYTALSLGGNQVIAYSGPASKRYMIVQAISYDMLVSLYDVNSAALFAGRIFESADRTLVEMDKFIRSFKRKPNLEARIIGLQNGSGTQTVSVVSDYFRGSNIGVFEIDLFGNEVRHIAIDAKLGTTYDVLLEDRIYRAGEKNTQITMDQFRANARSKA